MENGDSSDESDAGPHLVLDSAGRVACPAATASLDFGFRAFKHLFGGPTQNVDAKSAKNAPGSDSAAQQSDGLIAEVTAACSRAFDARASGDEGYSAGSTFWVPASATGGLCRLEALALDIFRFHTAACPPGSFDPSTSGAEWWAMVLEQSDEIGFHWDKDYSVEGQGVNVFPHLATVTYLSDVGSPTVVLQHVAPTTAGNPTAGTAGTAAMLSPPAPGKHISFDGRFLHAAPAALQQIWGGTDAATQEISPDVEPKQAPTEQRAQRISFLVNVWLNWKPTDVVPFPRDSEPESSKSSWPVPSMHFPQSLTSQTVTDNCATRLCFKLRKQAAGAMPETVVIPVPIALLQNAPAGNAVYQLQYPKDSSRPEHCLPHVRGRDDSDGFSDDSSSSESDDSEEDQDEDNERSRGENTDADADEETEQAATKKRRV